MDNHSSDYSVDMIRLSVRVERKLMELFIAQYLTDHIFVRYYQKNSYKEYRHNFSIHEPYDSCLSIENEKTRFWLGFQHYTEKSGGRDADLVIEFNPNKCAGNEGFLHLILSHFYYNSGAIEVKSCDICRDFDDIDMDTVTYEKNRKSHEIVFNTQKGRAKYLGKRGGHGTVKVYDKAAELKKTDKVCTRWEATLRFKELYIRHFLTDGVTVENLKVNLPTVHLGDRGFADYKDIKLNCVVHAIKSNFAKLADFSSHMQNKIKPHLESGALFTISNENLPEILETLKNYLKNFKLAYELEVNYLKNLKLVNALKDEE